MRIIKSINEINKLSRAAKRKGKVVGLVPTMGFLHEGHLALVDIAKKKCDLIICWEDNARSDKDRSNSENVKNLPHIIELKDFISSGKINLK